MRAVSRGRGEKPGFERLVTSGDNREYRFTSSLSLSGNTGLRWKRSAPLRAETGTMRFFCECFGPPVEGLEAMLRVTLRLPSPRPHKAMPSPNGEHV
jgi:hypothetical protein